MFLINIQLPFECKYKILESGSANSPLLFNASRRQSDWDNVVRAVPECAYLVSTQNTFDCLRNASSTDMLNAFEVSLGLANEQFPWVTTIDGPGGLLPELPSELYAKGAFSRIPFIAGTNVDEGMLKTPFTMCYLLPQRDVIHAFHH